jgi:hypothetical protein
VRTLISIYWIVSSNGYRPTIIWSAELTHSMSYRMGQRKGRRTHSLKSVRFHDSSIFN